jgi:hypothetical protein
MNQNAQIMKKARRKIPPHARNVDAKSAAITSSRRVDRAQSRFVSNVTLVPHLPRRLGRSDHRGRRLLRLSSISLVNQTTGGHSFQKLAATRSYDALLPRT